MNQKQVLQNIIAKQALKSVITKLNFDNFDKFR
jgi:hypothetical protein